MSDLRIEAFIPSKISTAGRSRHERAQETKKPRQRLVFFRCISFWYTMVVPVVGLEPTRCRQQRILSPPRLPIPTHRLICCLYSILHACQKIKIYFALIFTAIPHNSKCRYGERGAADAKPKAQIILDVLSSILATQMPCRSRRSGA